MFHKNKLLSWNLSDFEERIVELPKANEELTTENSTLSKPQNPKTPKQAHKKDIDIIQNDINCNSV